MNGCSGGVRMASLETIELKFLLRLLGSENYRSKIVAIKPNAGTKASERDKICKKLTSRGYVEYDSNVTKFKLAPPGKSLLSLDTANLPVTSEEMDVLKACKGSTTPGKLRKIPADDRQRMIDNLAERGMLEITDTSITEVWLSAQGKQFLANEYEPKGNSPVATSSMLGDYVSFLRENLGQSRRQSLPTGQPQNQRPLSQPGMQPSSAMPIGSQTKPDKQAVLQQIKQLDRQVGSKNYLPIYHLREKLQPPLARPELDSILYALQRAGQIDLDSLHDQGKYSQAQMAAGIRQDNGGYLFFISVQ